MTTQNIPADHAFLDSLREDMADSDPFSRAFGDRLGRILDPASWTAGADLASTYARLEQEVRASVHQERRIRNTLRERLLPRIEAAGLAGPKSGVYRATPEQIGRIHSGLLLNGRVEACDGIAMTHDTLAMTFIQLGVCMVSYDGDQQTWSQRMFRRDLRSDGSDALSEMLDVLDRPQGLRGRWTGSRPHQQARATWNTGIRPADVSHSILERDLEDVPGDSGPF